MSVKRILIAATPGFLKNLMKSYGTSGEITPVVDPGPLPWAPGTTLPSANFGVITVSTPEDSPGIPAEFNPFNKLWTQKLAALFDVTPFTEDDQGKTLIVTMDADGIKFVYGYPDKLAIARVIGISGDDVTPVSGEFDGSGNLDLDLEVLHSTNADHAVTADSATTATTATNADHATTADTATDATNALAKASNLSDLANVPTARTNLGLTELATTDPATIAKNVDIDFAIVYANGGTEAVPVDITTASRYEIPNPFPGYHVLCKAEVLSPTTGKWTAVTGFGIYNTSGSAAGVMAAEYDDKIVVMTGADYICVDNGGGYVIGSVAAVENITSAPCRVLCWKVKGAEV